MKGRIRQRGFRQPHLPDAPELVEPGELDALVAGPLAGALVELAHPGLGVAALREAVGEPESPRPAR